MYKITDYLNLSTTSKSINSQFTKPDSFAENFKAINPIEQDSYLKHYLIGNTPFVFKEMPILYEQIIKYLSDKLGVDSAEIKLIGSGKTGFSISPPPNYGKPFIESDLDFVIINSHLFNDLKNEFYILLNSYEESSKMFIPQYQEPFKLKSRSDYFWQLNVKHIPTTLARGFIDPYKIPYTSISPLSSNIQEYLDRIKDKLFDIHFIKTKPSTVRVYYNWNNFFKVLKNNTLRVLSDL